MERGSGHGRHESESWPIKKCLIEAQAGIRRRHPSLAAVGVDVFRNVLLTVDLTTDSGPGNDFVLEAHPTEAAERQRVSEAQLDPERSEFDAPADPSLQSVSDHEVTDPSAPNDDAASVPAQPSADGSGPSVQRLREGMERLLHSDPAMTSGSDLVEELLLVQDLQSFLFAASLRRMAALTAPGVAGDPTRLVERRMAENPMVGTLSPEQLQVVRDGETVLVAEQLAAAQVGAALKIAPGTASRRVREAVEFVEQLPLTVAALSDGHIDQQRARTLAERSRVLTADQRGQLEWEVLPEASSHTPTQWRNLVDAAVLALDPEAAEQRRKDAVERRRLRVERLEDGIGRFMAERRRTRPSWPGTCSTLLRSR